MSVSRNILLSRQTLGILILSAGLSSQANAFQVHAREVSNIVFTDASGGFFEHGYALVEELTGNGLTVYLDFTDQGNIGTGQVSSENFAFNLLGVSGLSSIGLDQTGQAYINNNGNTPALLGTANLISGSVWQDPASGSTPPSLAAALNGTFTPTAAGSSTLGLSLPKYTMSGSFLHYLFVDVLPVNQTPGDFTSPVIGFTINDVLAKDVLTLTAPVPVPGAIWLFGTVLAGFLGFSRRKILPV